MLRVFVLLGLLGLASSCLAEVLPLPALLDGADSTPLLRAAEAEGAALEALQRQREAEAGWQWFASAGTGRYRELVTEEVRDDYYGRDLALGLRHPLLGSLKRQQDALRSVEDQRQQQQARLQLARLEQRLALRSAYADWWRAQEELRWCDGIAEPARRAREQLAARLREGWLLASEARLQDGRWQALERRCAAAGPLLEETRYSLQSLSGQTIDARQQARAEALANAAQPLGAWLQQLERHPRLQERREQLRQAERNRQSPWYAAVDSSFSVAQSYEDRSGGNEPGNGLVASISLSAPFDPLSYGQARGDEGAARHQMALAQLDAERERLVQGLGQALRAQRAAAEDLLQARQQLEAAALAVREQRLRRASDVDQAYLGSLAAELEHGYAGLRLIAAWHGLWLREAALRLFVDDDVAHAPLLGPATLDWQAPVAAAHTAAAPRAVQWQQGVYLWDSHALLDEQRRAEALAQLRAAGMQRLYLGLDAAQVAEPERLRGQLRGLLEAARAQGFEVLLLLGDPHWLQADGRQGLLDLLGELSALPFAGLHLDLEVEQLGWPVPEARLRDWMDTLTAVAGVSPWPLELSSHHRWFAAPRAGEYCVPCELRQRGVRQVSLMIYTRNAVRSAELAADIARGWPGLSFRLAQSVEPQLAADESWSAASRAQLQAQTERWRQQLQPQAVAGIDWQDWSHYPH